MNKIFTLILILTNISLFAQSNCERNLQEARSDYNSGNLYAIPGKLTDCLEEGFSKTEKVEAYRLLTLTYLNINQNEKAKESFIKLLNLKTDYRVFPNIDPPELYSLYRKIDTDPQYFVGVIIGINYNTIQISNIYPTGTVRGATDINYSRSISFPEAGVQFILPVFKNFWVKVDAIYQKQQYNYTHTVKTFGETENIKYGYKSINNGININLSARSIIDNYKWKPFVEYGISGRFNINHDFTDYSSINTQLTDDGSVESTDDRSVDENIDMSLFRKKFNIGFNLHLGTMIKLGENYGEIKIGASKFLLDHASYDNKDYRNNKTIGNRGEIIDNDYKNLIYQMSFSFNIPFFNFQ